MSIETSLIATSTLVENYVDAQMVDIPFDLDIEVSNAYLDYIWCAQSCSIVIMFWFSLIHVYYIVLCAQNLLTLFSSGASNASY